MMSIVKSVLIAVVGLTAGQATLAGVEAQEVPVERITEPDVRYDGDFTDLRSLRVLSDNSVIAVDAVGGEVTLLAPDGRSSRPVGRRGQGPEEYMDPAAALPLADSDFTLLVDWGQQRLLIVDPAGSVIASEAWRLPIGAVPAARDASEGMYYDEAGMVRMDRTGRVIEGPAPLLRVTPGAEPDTVAMVRVYDLARRWEGSPVSRMFNPGANGVALFRLDQSPFGAQDEWALAPDGRIVIARAEPYRIEIVGRGQPIVGPEVDYEPLEITDGDRRDFVAGMSRGSGGGPMSFTGENGGTEAISPPGVDIESIHFPETKPPFPYAGLHLGPGQEIFVQRSVRRGADHSAIDVFDGTGRLVRRIELPPGLTLVGAGPGTLFTIRYDEFDLQILERFGLNGG
jgi:hypothetical protein